LCRTQSKLLELQIQNKLVIEMDDTYIVAVLLYLSHTFILISYICKWKIVSRLLYTKSDAAIVNGIILIEGRYYALFCCYEVN
jgi:hypothetical protein